MYHLPGTKTPTLATSAATSAAATPAAETAQGPSQDLERLHTVAEVLADTQVHQVLQELDGYTVWEGPAESGAPKNRPQHSFPANFTGTLRFANDDDPDYVEGYYGIVFKNGVATEVGIFDD